MSDQNVRDRLSLPKQSTYPPSASQQQPYLQLGDDTQDILTGHGSNLCTLDHKKLASELNTPHESQPYEKEYLEKRKGVSKTRDPSQIAAFLTCFSIRNPQQQLLNQHDGRLDSNNRELKARNICPSMSLHLQQRCRHGSRIVVAGRRKHSLHTFCMTGLMLPSLVPTTSSSAVPGFASLRACTKKSIKHRLSMKSQALSEFSFCQLVQALT